MKKFFLSMAVAAMAAVTVNAEEVNFTFTGAGALYGLTRQTANSPTAIASPTLIEEGGVEITLNQGSGAGFALAMNKMVTWSGLQILPNAAGSSLTITAPGAMIKKVDMAFNTAVNHTVDGVTENTNSYSWEGSTDALTMEFGSAAARTYIKTIDVTFEAGGVVKEKPGISFSSPSVEVIYGHEFETPELSNPNNLVVTWSSSDSNVATVDAEGKVAIVGAGTSTITAATEETEEYMAGNTFYVIKVIPSANTIAGMLSQAAVKGDQVYVAMPLTVTYANPIVAYVVDAEGNATRLNVNNSLKVGDVIPAGWMATNSTASNYVQFNGSLPEEITETVAVTYPEVEDITVADNNRVLTLLNVKFAEATEADNSTTFVGKTALDSTFTFKNQFVVDPVNPGTYNVTLAVKAWYSSMYDKDMFELNPISYNAVAEEPKYVIKNETINFDNTTTSTTQTELDLPYSFTGKNTAFTFVEQTPSNVKYPGFWVAKRGVIMKAGTGLLNVSAGDDKITKIVIKTENPIVFKVNDVVIPAVGDEYSTEYVWERPEDFTQNEVSIYVDTKIDQWTNSAVWFTYAEVYYETLDDGKVEPELSFTSSSLTLSTAQKTLDPATILVNPENVPVTYTSSDENVAAVEDGIIKLLADGLVTITATSEATDGFSSVDAKFSLIVVDAAFNIEQLEILAPETGDKAVVDPSCVLYIARALSGNYEVEAIDNSTGEVVIDKMKEAFLFVEDKEGNTALLQNANVISLTSYGVDDYLDKKWTATNCANAGVQTYYSGAPTKTGRNLGWFDAPQEVTSLEGVTDLKVVNLKNVSLAAGVPADKGAFEGKVNGADLTLYNLVNGTKKISGVYDIIGAAGVSPEGKQVYYPIEYTFVSDLAPEFPETLNVTTDSEHVTVSVEYDEDYEMNMINISGTTSNEDGLKVTVEVPAGWSNVLSMIQVMDVDYGLYPVVKKAAPAEWVPVSNLTEEGAVLGNVITIPNKPAMGGIYLVYDDKADMANYYALQSNVTYESTDPSAVEVIEAVDADAVYYSLQGVEVKNPANGIYVKVLNGKASKVAIK